MRGRARAHRPALGVTAVHRDTAGHEAHLPCFYSFKDMLFILATL